MDPVSIAAAAVTALSPYLAKAAGKAAEAAGSAAFEQGRKLLDKLKARFAGSPVESKQLQKLEAEPDNPLHRAVVEGLLGDALKEDPKFLAEIAALVGAAGTGQVNVFKTQATTMGNVTNVGTLHGGMSIVGANKQDDKR